MKIQRNIFFILFNLSFLSTYAQTALSLPVCDNEIAVIAHRGSHLVKPENTIAAIEDAIRLGADYVEIDVRTTKDKHIVLSHNESVDSKTNGQGLVKELSFDQIKQLNIKGGDGQIYQVPEFKEALKACKGKINIYLDFKDADAQQVYEQILAEGMEKNVLVYLNGTAQYRAWKKIAPKMPLMGSLPDWVKTKADVQKFCTEMQFQAVDNAKTETLIAALRDNSVNVFLDGQQRDESPISWKNLLRLKIQGIQTDHPEALIKYLRDLQLHK